MTTTPADKRTRAILNAQRRTEAAVVLSIAAGNSITNTCEMTGASRPLVTRLVNDPDIQVRIRDERARVGSEITAALATHARRAADYLVSIVNDPTAPDGARVRAAGLLLSEARAWRSDDIEERLTALENAQPRHLIAVPN